jgi:O-antigen ligase
VLIGAAMVLTYSRGAWLLGVPASLLFLAAVRGRRALIVTSSLLALVVLLAALTGGARLGALLDPGEGTTSFRLQLWTSSLAMVRDHPLLGVGLDNFLYQYRSHYVLPTAWEEINLSHPHNVVLDFWLRLGLAGVALLAWLMVGLFRRGWSAYRALAGAQDGLALMVLGAMAGVVSMLAHGLVDNAFFLVDLAFAFMIAAALVQGATSDPGEVTGNLFERG